MHDSSVQRVQAMPPRLRPPNQQSGALFLRLRASMLAPTVAGRGSLDKRFSKCIYGRVATGGETTRDRILCIFCRLQSIVGAGQDRIGRREPTLHSRALSGLFLFCLLLGIWISRNFFIVLYLLRRGLYPFASSFGIFFLSIPVVIRILGASTRRPRPESEPELNPAGTVLLISLGYNT